LRDVSGDRVPVLHRGLAVLAPPEEEPGTQENPTAVALDLDVVAERVDGRDDASISVVDSKATFVAPDHDVVAGRE
jgi:hypothetical protein